MKYIAITKSDINGAEINSVNSRDIHKELEIKTKYSDWVKRVIDKYEFEEEKDYTVLKNGNGNNATLDYIVTIDMAKELCMVTSTKKGREYRKYFISIEKQANKQSNLQLDIQMQRLDALTNVAHATKESIDNHTQRIENLERNTRLEAWQEKSLLDAKNKKVYELANDDKKLANSLHRKVWSLFKKRFHLPRYNELKTGQYENGLEFINSLTLADMVG